MTIQDKETFELELERIRQTYARFEQEQRGETIWAPFNETEAAYRSQQIIALAACFRKISHNSLRGMRILDFGCGNGRLLRSFVDMGADPGNLMGVDLLPELITEAKRVSHPNINFEVCSGSILDFPDGQFDLVTQFVVFSSIRDGSLRQQLASEMVRVLRTSGYIFWWDTLRLAPSCGEDVLLVESLFPTMEVAHSLYCGRYPKLQECSRYVFGVSRLLKPLLNWLSYPVTHRAVLLGPKGKTS